VSIKTLKTISLSIVLSLLLVLLAGCGGPADTETDKPEESSPAQSTPTPSAPSEEESGEDEVTYDFGGRTIRYVNWGHPGPTEVTPKREDRIPELEKKFNCKFEFFTIPMDNYLETFTSSTLAGDPMAEIVQMHIMWFYPGLASKGFLTPLDDLGVFDFDDPKWDPLMKKYGSFKGKIYSMATGKTPPQGGIFWNKTLFERDNLPDLYELQNNYEWTWDKFREIAILATRDTDGDGSIDQWGIEKLSCRLPKGAFYVMMNISQLIGKRYGNKVITGSISFAEALLESKMVSVVPGIAFGADSFVRLSYATSLENIAKGLDRIESFTKELE
jgi:multiple sugar transport system substrate-binding protein